MRLLATIALLLFAAPTHAQNMQNALVVSSCGAPALTNGSLTNLTMNPTGQLCLGGTFGVFSAWSPADATAKGMTLSNAGLTVTPSGTGAWQTIRTTVSKTAGKLYVEFKTLSPIASSGGMGWGVADTGFGGTYLGSANYSGGNIGGTTLVSSGFTSNYAIVNYGDQNDVWALAVDFAAGKIWIAKNNAWQNGSNPATGSLPFISFVPATVGALFPAMSFFGAVASTGVWTLQATTASQTYAAPSGFKAWDAP